MGKAVEMEWMDWILFLLLPLPSLSPVSCDFKWSLTDKKGKLAFSFFALVDVDSKGMECQRESETLVCSCCT
jgi:hypothetical protein